MLRPKATAARNNRKNRVPINRPWSSLGPVDGRHELIVARKTFVKSSRSKRILRIAVFPTCHDRANSPAVQWRRFAPSHRAKTLNSMQGELANISQRHTIQILPPAAISIDSTTEFSQTIFQWPRLTRQGCCDVGALLLPSRKNNVANHCLAFYMSGDRHHWRWPMLRSDARARQCPT